MFGLIQGVFLGLLLGFFLGAVAARVFCAGDLRAMREELHKSLERERKARISLARGQAGYYEFGD